MSSHALVFDVGLPGDGFLSGLRLRRAKLMKAIMPVNETASPEASLELNARMSANIVAIAQAGDRAAFRSVFEFYAPRVKSFLMRSGGDAARAEEVTQETMVAVWRKAHLFDPQKASAATWIFTIARNLRIDAYRKERRPEIDPEDPLLQISAPADAMVELAGAQDAAALGAAMAELNADDRQLLQLAYYKDRSQSQIASELGLPLGTVKSRMRQIYSKLRTRLEHLERDPQ